MYEYTKQEVKGFLQTETDRNDVLKKALTTRGYEVSTNRKRGEAFRFVLDKELKCALVKEFGFKPARPTYTRILIKVLHEDFGGVCHMTYRELSKYIEEKYGITIQHTHLGEAYRELTRHGRALELAFTTHVLLDYKGDFADEQQVEEFKSYLHAKTAEGYEFGRVWNTGLVLYSLRAVKGKMLNGIYYTKEQ